MLKGGYYAQPLNNIWNDILKDLNDAQLHLSLDKALFAHNLTESPQFGSILLKLSVTC